MPDKTKRTYVLDESGEWQQGGVDMDYSKLENAPIILANLAEEGFVPEANTYYEHLGETTGDFVKGIIYFYNGTEYKAIDGSGSGGIQPDYNQNDSTAPDYIKNRPFYSELSLTEVADLKVISGNLKEAGSEVTVEYNGERFTGTVTEDSGDYELQIEGSEQAGFGGQVNITNEGAIFYYSHKKTYEIKSGDEIIFNGVKYLAKLFTSGEVAGKFYISDGEIDPETLHPISSASFMYIFSMMDEGEFALDYYVIYKSTTDVDFNIKINQRTIKTIDPKFIKDMYYTEVKDITMPVYNGSLTSETGEGLEVATFNPENIFELGDMVMLKIPSKKIDVITPAKKYDEAGICYIGNVHLMGIGDDTGEDYFIYAAKNDEQDVGGFAMQTSFSNMEVEINVKRTDEVIYKLDKKYLPDGTATESYVDTAIKTAITTALNTEV